MQLNINSLINKHLNEPCLLLGPSPSMSNFNFNEFNGQIITFGDTILRGEKFFKANYWIASNNEFPVPNYDPHLKIINYFLDTTFIFSDTALYNNLWTYDENFLIDNLKVNWVKFDERHFKGQHCVPKNKCCELLKENPNRKTIQEIVSQFFNSKIVVSEGYTVAVYALCFALIMGCNPIYIQGVDLPFYKNEYTYFTNKDVDKMKFETKKFIRRQLYLKNSKKNLLSRLIKKIYKILNFGFKKESVFNDDFEFIINSFDEYFRVARKKNVKIFYLNSESNLSKCKNIDFLDYKNIF